MNLFQKMAEVMKDIEYLKKDDTVEYKTTRYKAISEEKVTSAVRASLIKNGIVVFPVSQDFSKNGQITAVNTTYRFQNIDDPEDYILAASSGEGYDTQDKGVGKAMTYAYKYLMLRTFAIPTGEDPDKVSSAEIDDKEKEKPLLCLICHNPIQGFTDPKGRWRTPQEVANNFGGHCMECERKIREENKKGVVNG